MGGDISFESDGVNGRGSVFTLSVPVAVTRMFTPPPPIEAPGHYALQLLLIEQQPSLRNLLESLLHMLAPHAEVLAFETVAQAEAMAVGAGGKRRASELNEDGVLLTVALMDQQLAPVVRQGMLSQRVQAIVTYSYAKDDVAGAGDGLHVKKPIRPSRLRAALLTAVVNAREHRSGDSQSESSQTRASHVDKRFALPPDEAKRNPNLRILVAEDNASNQLILQKYLEMLGYSNFKCDPAPIHFVIAYTFRIVENGQEAVKAATTTLYDVILMDVMYGIPITSFRR